MHIGVVIPAYNAADWISDAIASVLAQTHRGWTLVVVDDGSTDATADVVAGFADRRIRLIRQANAGAAVARNVGMAACMDVAEGLLLLDADDALAPDALTRLSAALDAAPDAVAASGPCVFSDTGAIRRPPGGDLLERLLVRNLFANGGQLLVRTDVLRAAGGFVPGIVYGEDWELWIRLALRGPFAAVPGRAPVLLVRQHAGGAYHRLATDPGAFAACMRAIFTNPTLRVRIGADRLAAIRRRTDAENDWIIGRELIRHGRGRAGIAWLRRSVSAHRSVRRTALFAAAFVVPLLPRVWRGPFRPYRAFTSMPHAALRVQDS